MCVWRIDIGTNWRTLLRGCALPSIGILVTMLSSCAPEKYVAKADGEVYEILSRAESSVFKKKQNYTVRSTVAARSIRSDDLLAMS